MHLHRTQRITRRDERTTSMNDDADLMIDVYDTEVGGLIGFSRWERCCRCERGGPGVNGTMRDEASPRGDLFP